MMQLIASIDGVEVQRHTLAKTRTRLGRKPYNDIVVESGFISSEHCLFDVRPGDVVFVEDLGSTNGTFVNGYRIKSAQRLNNRDIIALGNVRIRCAANGHSADDDADGDADVDVGPASSGRSAKPAPATGFDSQFEAGSSSVTSMGFLESIGVPGTSGALQAALKMLTGTAANREMPLVKAVTTLGKPGAAVVCISHRRDGYYVAKIEGERSCSLNGAPLTAEAVVMKNHDVLQVGKSRLEFLLKNL